MWYHPRKLQRKVVQKKKKDFEKVADGDGKSSSSSKFNINLAAPSIRSCKSKWDSSSKVFRITSILATIMQKLDKVGT